MATTEDKDKKPKEEGPLRRTGSSRLLLISPKDSGKQKFVTFLESFLSNDVNSVCHSIVDHFEYTLSRNKWNFDRSSLFQAAAYSLRDRMIEYFNATQEHFYTCRVKRAYYLSIEFLMGRTLTNALANTGLTSPFSEAMNEFGEKLEAIAEREQDPGLGSGGLGRLAACFLDSLATLDYPAWGYGIRYKYGQFIQAILHNQQIEVPDFWLETGNPWEILRHDIHYDVGFYGHTEYQASPDGSIKIVWIPGNTVNAVAYDTAIPGFGTHNTLGLRLWSSQPSCRCRAEEALMQDPWETLRLKQRDEEITSVLYPRADSDAGRELRLKQQYFFSSASLQDILRRFAKMDEPLTNLPNHAAIQLNDTHPSISIPELMRLLMDVEDLGWESAWEIVTHVFAFTNHTVMPEALEKWPVAMMERVLPRHLQIIYEINRRFLEQIAGKGFEPEVISKLSIIEEHPVKAVRMANLAIVGSHTVNGVARIHSEILRATIFSDFEKLWPGKIINITNGVTPRRWIHCANPWLSEAITRHLGDSSWVRDLSLIGKLRQNITPQLLQDVSAANRRAKDRLREHLSAITASKVIDVDTSALFDVQVKRIHEYKRQLLNVLGVIHRYLVLKDMTPDQRAHEVKRVHIFAGKAAASYRQAKAVIKLICNVSDVIGNDPETSHYLRAFFLPNYSVSLAELIIPATDVSEHISTAGTEASGTSNMKFALNAGLILGTLDGANVEIAEAAGRENLFIFGATAEEVNRLHENRIPRPLDVRLSRVLKEIQSGRFGNYENYRDLIEPLWPGTDYYCVAHDFPHYLEAQHRVDMLWRDQAAWSRQCVNTMSAMGTFSSDHSIRQYANRIWGIKPCKLPDPETPTKLT